MSAATIKDVARIARVSTATVSAVINGSSFVSASLKARVIEAVAELGYAPSGVARSLRMQSTRLIGIVVADITNPFFAEFVRLAGVAAQARGYSVLLCEADHDAAKERAALELLVAHRVDGVILCPTGPAAMYGEPPVSTFPKPIVMVDRIIPDAPFDTVSIDNHCAAYDLTNHILSLGHTRLAIVAGSPHLSNTTDRLAGFSDALLASGLAPDPSNVIYADFRQDRARELCHTLLARPDRPTALFVSNNQMMIGAMQALTELGLSCPADVSLAGIDDFPWAGTFAPRLTAQKQPIEALADHAVRILQARMQDVTRALEHIVLRSELIIRESCAPPADAARSSRPNGLRAADRRRTPPLTGT